MASFVSNLHRITAPVKEARKLEMPNFWLHDPDLPVYRIEIPFSGSVGE